MKNHEKNINLMTDDINFSGSDPKILSATHPDVPSWVRELEASKDLKSTRASWRPLTGPAKDIPQKTVTASDAINTDELEEQKKKTRLEAERQNWRPGVGPLAL